MRNVRNGQHNLATRLPNPDWNVLFLFLFFFLGRTPSRLPWGFGNELCIVRIASAHSVVVRQKRQRQRQRDGGEREINLGLRASSSGTTIYILWELHVHAALTQLATGFSLLA